ncbi:hypothetical protein QBC38DRAFT_516350 [Podospora fimiseda]|uniref:GH16 domain-containing protein n=1 Tax=Podospora fimiseda TaxID=252190 RepID=A0AAN7H6Y9_9PEZI|nr:hypothetical protein QBC38DRAFT_516350 [Podospora fimiseda]
MRGAKIDSKHGQTAPKRSILKPKGWPRRVWLFLGSGVLLIVIVVVVVVVVGAVVGVKATKMSDHSIGEGPYPDYAKLKYALADVYLPSRLFSQFEYFDGEDPSNRFVQYSSEQDALQRVKPHFRFFPGKSVIIRADNSENATNGRRSIRLQSKKQYKHGLFIFDVKHSPYGCNSQPAFWLADPNNWPENGEAAQAAAWKVKRKMLGSFSSHDCSTARPGFLNGCMAHGFFEGQNAKVIHTMGEGYNQEGGGVVAMEYRKEGIRIWQFKRNEIPKDISLDGEQQQQKTSSPDPKSWGPAFADFPSTNCDIGSHFKNQSIIVNINFCGDGPYGWGADCSQRFPQYDSCEAFVSANGTAFDNTYWEFGSFQVFQAQI